MEEIVKHINDTNASYRTPNAGDAKNTDLFLDNEHYEMFKGLGEQITVRYDKENLSKAILFIASILPRKYDNSAIHKSVSYSPEFVYDQLALLDYFFKVDGVPVVRRTQIWNARKDVPKKNGEIDNRFYFNGLLEEVEYVNAKGEHVSSKFTIRNYIAGGYSDLHIKKADDGIFDVWVTNVQEPYFDDKESEQEEIDTHTSQSSSRQIIFYGTPGTGKSNKIEEATNDDNRIRTTFHPDSDYSTFVGAYKPTMQNEDKYLERLCDIDYLASLFKNDYYKADKKTVAVDTFAIKYAEYLDGKYGKVSLKELCEKAEVPTGHEVALRDSINAYHACVKPQIKPNQIAYSFVPQAFLKAYVEAWKRMDKGNETPYYLVIEEINRGNCAQIFGDLFQLLDRNDEGESRYAIAPDDDIKRHLEKELANCTNIPEKIMKGEEMRLPSNLYIWATMNTSDQSLFPIDSAFKRRWDWEYMPIENGNKGFVIDIAGTQYDWWDFISTINAKIDRITGSEDKKLGYWFAKPSAGKTSIDCQLFVSKVLFYLWNDVYKDYADSKDSIFRADNNGQSVKTPFTTFFGSGREERVKAFMAFNGIQPVVIKEG